MANDEQAPDEFVNDLLKMAEEAGTPVYPMAFLDTEHDCCEFLFEPANYYAERIDDLITIYRNQVTKEIVGSLIKGVRKRLLDLLSASPGFRCEITDGRIRLSHFFSAVMWSNTMTDLHCVTIYRKLRDIAETQGIEAPLGEYQNC